MQYLFTATGTTNTVDDLFVAASLASWHLIRIMRLDRGSNIAELRWQKYELPRSRDQWGGVVFIILARYLAEITAPHRYDWLLGFIRLRNFC